MKLYPEQKIIFIVALIVAMIEFGIPLEKYREMNAFCHRYYFDYAEEESGRWSCTVRIPPVDDRKGGQITLQTMDVGVVPDYELEAYDARKERDP